MYGQGATPSASAAASNSSSSRSRTSSGFSPRAWTNLVRALASALASLVAALPSALLALVMFCCRTLIRSASITGPSARKRPGWYLRSASLLALRWGRLAYGRDATAPILLLSMSSMSTSANDSDNDGATWYRGRHAAAASATSYDPTSASCIDWPLLAATAADIRATSAGPRTPPPPPPPLSETRPCPQSEVRRRSQPT